MTVITAPEPVIDLPEYANYLYIFLAGSIEQGKAVQWQQKVISRLSDTQVVLLNPRRDDWDSTLAHDSTEMGIQIQWELHGIERSDIVIFYFDRDTYSPITLAELGLCAGLKKRGLVYCPNGFWRQRNVIEMCKRYPGLSFFDDYQQWEETLLHTIAYYCNYTTK